MSEKQLATFLAKYDPEIQAIVEGARKKMQKLWKGAIELVYDNYNALVIAYCPNDRGSKIIGSIAAYPKWVRLFFMKGTELDDPMKRLEGGGGHIRSVRLQSPKTLDEPAVRLLIAQAKAIADIPLDPKQPRKVVIRAVVKKQRARRASSKKKK